MKGEPVSKGIAHGIAFLISQEKEVKARSICSEAISQELKRFYCGRTRAVERLEELIEKVQTEMDQGTIEIFEGHLEILLSDDLEEEIVDIIRSQLVNAEEAARIFGATNAQEMQNLEDDYFKERGQDFIDIAGQLIAGIQNDDENQCMMHENAVIVSNRLVPSQTASFDLEKIAGFVIHTGGLNSHAAIIARSKGLPAVILRDPDPMQVIKNGDDLWVDGYTGDIWINPDEKDIAYLTEKLQKIRLKQERVQSISALASESKDHQSFGLYANVGTLSDIASAVAAHADGIGLFRTEFLFMETDEAPSKSCQKAIYAKAITALEGKQVIIRLLDTGADKPISYIPLQQEDNPYLGLRGIRLLFSFEQILRTQLQAILLASESGPVGVMIPMVSSLETVRRVRSILNEEIALLGWASAPNLSLGIMVETPSAVVMIEELLQEVDFVSIGTNDLTQYTLAADRGNPDVDCYYDEFHPAVIRSIAKVISSSKEKQIRNGVCGELAGNVLALPFFMGLGVDELSANPVVLAELKYAMRQIDSRDAQVLVDEILKLTSSKDIRARLHAFLHERGLLR